MRSFFFIIRGMNILNKLEKLELGYKEEKIRALILDDPDGFVTMGIEEVMERSGAARATFYRLCDKLQVSGFADLRIHINKDKEDWKKTNTAFDFNYPVEDGAAVQRIAENLAEDYAKTVMMTKNLLDVSVLRRAALEMEKAKAIDIYTSAGNIHFAKNFAFQMKEIGVDVHVPEELYLQKLLCYDALNREEEGIFDFSVYQSERMKTDAAVLLQVAKMYILVLWKHMPILVWMAMALALKDRTTMK